MKPPALLHVGGVGPIDEPAASPPRSAFHVASSKCDPDDLCAIYPAFPQVTRIYVNREGTILEGIDRRGTLGPKGWDFTSAAFDATSTPWLEGKVEDEKRVWAWKPNEVTFSDGSRPVERLATPPSCRLRVVEASVETEGKLYFTQCEADEYMDASLHTWLVEVDRSTLQAARMPGFSEVLGLVRMPSGGALAAGWDTPSTPLRYRVYGADGHEISNEAAPDTHVPRKAFPDGVMFATEPRFFDAVDRLEGKTWKTVLKLSAASRGFWAASSREVWAGGAELARWQDGKVTTKIPYRKESGSVVHAIGGSGSNDVWVASSHDPDLVVRLSHWDGKAWSQHDLALGETAVGSRGEVDVGSIAVASPTEAWVVLRDALYRWDGKKWKFTNVVTSHSAWLITLTPEALWLSGNATIYRRPR